MITKIFSTCALLVLLSLTLVSCKKKNKEMNLPVDALTGTWQEITTGYNRVLIFEPGGKITILIKNSQYADWHIKLTGKYIINEDNLSATITEQSEKQSSGSVITNPVNIRWFDQGKFNIKNFVLTVNYKTYPADAPVDTESKFNKIVPID
ncbi:hypothetical protein [Pedobacter rhodius]|uniref:Lipocalin-like domain-containing protein n=1 Tax=Pedobacter rhodius TaxID=3004098 RepID=A0ABT4KTJ5_9SPHI|nr:hypothetical protein [Pedobacter sp. SJ11]MCZ4222149.1 hypothetical protein [Pedobacter sp. SJ11]